MPILLNQLHVQGVAIHEVPIRHGASPLVLTDGECVLDDDMRAYFAERLRNTLTRAVSVVLDATSPSPVPDVIRGYLQGAVDLLPASQRLATALYSIQTYVNNPGLLALTRLEVGGELAVGILKLQKETGMRGELVEAGPLRRYNVDLIRNIFFTDDTRVFKAGVFMLDGERVDGLVSDQQAAAPSRDVAGFFLSDFLGCRYATSPERATQAFLKVSEDFVNAELSDPLEQTRFEQGLLAELASQHHQVDPHAIATGYLPAGSRQAYLAHLEAEGVGQRPFRKDTLLIRNQIDRIQYKFRGATVLVDPGSVEDGTVTIAAIEDRKTRLTVEDILEGIRGK